MKIPRAKPFWLLLKMEQFRAWAAETRKKNTAYNETVQTRQVSRRKNFESAMHSINQQAGLEERWRRRRMARSLAKRWWVAGADKRAAQGEGAK